MTVRTWFTISAIVVIALFGAVALKLTAPVGPPSIVARVGETRLGGALMAACWPTGSGPLKCTQGGRASRGDVAVVPRHGKIRVIVAYPLQPKQGYIQVFQAGHVFFHDPWKEETSYDLRPGHYQLIALAQYPKQVHVQYIFDFRVR